MIFNHAYPRRSINLSKGCLKKTVELFFKAKLKNGNYIREFEKRFADYIGVKAAIGVSSARTGLYLGLKALNFSPDTEVIMPSYNYYPITRILKQLKLKPIFVDVNPDTYNIDSSLIKDKISEKTGAIIVTHMFGNPCEMDTILNITQDKRIILIEDCSHACGAYFKSNKLGSFGDIAIFSFGLGKNLPCFGGGMLLVQDAKLFSRIRTIVDSLPFQTYLELFKNIFVVILCCFLTGRIFFTFFTYPVLRLINFLIPGFIENCRKNEDYFVFSQRHLKRLSNLQAAMGIIQLSTIESTNTAAIRNAERLNSLLDSCPDIKITRCTSGGKHIYLYYNLRVKNRTHVIQKLLKYGIITQAPDISDCSEKVNFNNGNNCLNASLLVEELIEIPNSSILTESDIEHIAKSVTKAARLKNFHEFY